jgi:uncharacterized protein (DUF1330 family)
MRSKMPVYAIANLTVTDPALFRQYRKAAVPLVTSKGGKYLIMDFRPNDMDGQSRLGLIVIEFESAKIAEEFYNSPAYQEIVGLRLASTEGWLRIAPVLALPQAVK